MTTVPLTRSGCWIPFGPDTLPASLVGGKRSNTINNSNTNNNNGAAANRHLQYTSAAHNATKASRYLRKTLLYSEMPWDVNLYDVAIYPAPYGGPIAAFSRGSNVIEIYNAAGRYMTEFPIPSQLTNPNLGVGAGANIAPSAAAARMQSKANIVTMGWDAEETLMVLTDTCHVYMYRLGMSTAGCSMATFNHLNDKLSAPPNTNATRYGSGSDVSPPFLLVGCDESPISLLADAQEPFDICFASIGQWGVVVQDTEYRLRGISVAERRAPRYFMVDLQEYVDCDITALDVLPTEEGADELVFVIAPGRGDRQPRRYLKKSKAAEIKDETEVTGTLLLAKVDLFSTAEEGGVNAATGEVFMLPAPSEVTVLNLYIPEGVCNVRCDKLGEKIALYTYGGEVIVMNGTLTATLFKYKVGVMLRPSPFLWVGPDVLLLQFSMAQLDFSRAADMDNDADEVGEVGDTFDDGPTDDITFLLSVNKQVHADTRRMMNSYEDLSQNPTTIINTQLGSGASNRRSVGPNGASSMPRKRDFSVMDRHKSLFGGAGNGGGAGGGGGAEGQASGIELAHRFGFPQPSDNGHLFHFFRWEHEGGLCKAVLETDGVRLITERNTYLLEWVPQCVVEVQKPPSIATLVAALGANHPESYALLQHLSSASVGASTGAAGGSLSIGTAAGGGGGGVSIATSDTDLSSLALPSHFLPLPARFVQCYHSYMVHQNIEGLAKAKALVASLRTEENYSDFLGTILNAALFEWDVDVQERLLRVVAFALSECTVSFSNYHGGGGGAAVSGSLAHHSHSQYQDSVAAHSQTIDHHADYLEKTRLIRILNALRHTRCGIPLSVRQFEELTGSNSYENKITAHVIVDRLVNRHQFPLAISIANETRLKTQPIFVKWSCIKVLSASEDTSDNAVRAQLTKVMKSAPGATLTDTAMMAFRARRTTLAVNLLDDDPKPISKVMLFMKINNDIIALERACEANDGDLVFLVLLKMLTRAQKRQQQIQMSIAAQHQYREDDYGSGFATHGNFIDIDYDAQANPSSFADNSSSSALNNNSSASSSMVDNSAYDTVINALSLQDGVPMRTLTHVSRVVGKWEGIVAKYRRTQGRACWAGYRLLYRLLAGDDDVCYCGPLAPRGKSVLVPSNHSLSTAGEGDHRSEKSDVSDHSDGNDTEGDDDDDVDEDTLTEEEREKRIQAAVAKRKRQLEKKKKKAEKADKKKGKKGAKKSPSLASAPPPPRVEPTGTVSLPVGPYDFLTTDQISSVIVRLNTVPASAQAASDANYLRLHTALIAEQESIAREYGDSMHISYEEDLAPLSVLGTIAFCLEKGLEQKATELKTRFNIKESAFWHTKVKALVKAHRFSELDAFGRAHDPKFTKSPIGWLPFIDALNAVGGLEDRMVPYIDKLPSTVAKVTWFASIKRYGKAADAAFKDEEIGMLEQLLTYSDMDRSVREYIQNYIKELS